MPSKVILNTNFVSKPSNMIFNLCMEVRCITYYIYIRNMRLYVDLLGVYEKMIFYIMIAFGFSIFLSQSYFLRHEQSSTEHKNGS